MLTVDGSQGEGGGQLVRAAVTLSALTGTPVTVTRVRENRRNPGLGFQHCAAIRAVAGTCCAEVRGNEPGSRQVSFLPGKIRDADQSIAVGTAGSIPLVIQAWLPAALEAGGTLEVTGGTEVPMSPTIDYLEKVLLPALGPAGRGVKIEIRRRGYYPAGGGAVRVTADPACPVPISIPRDGSCGIRSCSSGLPAHVTGRQAERAAAVLSGGAGRDFPAEIRLSDGPSRGSSCTVWCGAKGCCSFGRPGLPAEAVGEAAARCLLAELAGPWDVDAHLSDQLLISLARYGGRYSAAACTLHARTLCGLLGQFGFPVNVSHGDEVTFSA